MKGFIFLTIFCVLSAPALAFACKMSQEEFQKRSKSEVEKFIKDRFPTATVESMRVLNSGRIRIVSRDPIPRLYRAVYSADCKATVNVIRNK